MSARLETRGTLIALGEESWSAFGVGFRVHRFASLLDGRPLVAVTIGDLASDEPLLARVHSSCITSEFLGGVDCDCAEQLEAAFATIAEAGRGAVFYLDQEGRGAGLVAKARDRMLVQASRHDLTTFDAYEQMGFEQDFRRYDEVAFATRLLGIRAPLRVLSNNPDKVEALARLGVELAGIEPIGGAASPFNAHYLAAKSRAGHAFDPPNAAPPPALPEPVVAFAPEPLAGAPRVLRVASYFLPIRGRWLRLHVHFDLDAGRALLAATSGTSPDGRSPTLLRIERERVLDRFPGLSPRREGWLRAVGALVAAPAGAALIRSERDGDELTAAELAVIARLVPGRSITPLLDVPRAPGDEAAFASLARAGFALATAVETAA